MAKLNSKIVVLDGQRYLVYLKQVMVKEGKGGKKGTTIKAFVKRLEDMNQEKKLAKQKYFGIIRNYTKYFLIFCQ